MTVSTIRRASRALFALALFAFLMAPAAQAQISSDRPGFSNSAATVSQGTFQAELGYDLSQDTGGSETFSTHSLGLLLFRYGVTERVEVRANVGSIGFEEQLNESNASETEFDSGYNGASVEAKVKLFENATTTVSGFSSTTLPLATGPFESFNEVTQQVDERLRQTLALLLDGALGENITLTVNGGTSFFWDAGVQDDRSFDAIFIPTLSFSINDMTGAYVGYFGRYNEAENTNFVEGGFTYLLSPDTQIDINTGFRVDDNADGYFLGLGLAQRF